MEDLTIAWIEDEHEYKMLLRGSACTDVHIATSLSAAHVALQQVSICMELYTHALHEHAHSCTGSGT